MSTRRTRSVCPASGPPMTPAAASGLCSLSTRWAARSRVCQPSHRVGARGPVSSSSAHRAARSSRAKLIPRWYALPFGPADHRSGRRRWPLHRIRPCEPDGTRDEPGRAAFAARSPDRGAAQARPRRIGRGHRPAVRHRRGADAGLDGRGGAAPHADYRAVHLLVPQPAGVLGQGRDLGARAARGLGGARLRRGRGARQGGPGRRRLPHRGPDLFRCRPAGRERPVTATRERHVTPTREYVLVLGVAAAGAVLVLLSVRQGWARVVTAATGPLPGAAVQVSGQDLVPVAGALAVASLASLAAVIATRSLARRLVGVFLAASGALTALLVIMPVSSADVLAAARVTPLAQAGSATAGGGPGTGGGGVPGAGVAGLGAAHVMLASFPWRPLALVGALAVLVAGIMVAWRG